MNKPVEWDQYCEDMLTAQYEIANIFSHEGDKGTVREDFLKTTLETCTMPSPIFVTGTLIAGEDDAGQLDIILCKPFSQSRKLGTKHIVDKNDALCVIEVKGNCTGKDLKNAVKKALTIRNLQGQTTPQYGVICYKVDLELKTIMNRFGFVFDRETDTYIDNATTPGEAESDWHQIAYPDLDFFVSLEEDKKLFLKKSQVRQGKYRFVQIVQTPLITELFRIMKSLWTTAHQAPAP